MTALIACMPMAQATVLAVHCGFLPGSRRLEASQCCKEMCYVSTTQTGVSLEHRAHISVSSSCPHAQVIPGLKDVWQV